MHFIQCNCGYYDHIGLPCAHVFYLVGPNMFQFCHCKVYNVHYGDNSNVGKLMIEAQVRIWLLFNCYKSLQSFDLIAFLFLEEHFWHEGMGVCISSSQNVKLAHTHHLKHWNGKKIYLAHNTTVQDLAKGNFVLIKSEESGLTTTDFMHFSEMKDDHQLPSVSSYLKIGSVASIEKTKKTINPLHS